MLKGIIINCIRFLYEIFPCLKEAEFQRGKAVRLLRITREKFKNGKDVQYKLRWVFLFAYWGGFEPEDIGLSDEEIRKMGGNWQEELEYLKNSKLY